ncbi:polysaccharide deacetylase family protein [Lapidilactobacillus mulanensis]|uniref:Polysaccharide deacetylase family protein n=1 Tax=Lapidilactobacillus mulanensis TaxID=2485999 RepID=A0ABW4DMR2_9LACO|nr:polysaccharide deacetylase family protein [Lapidilactobacillus mulanensis]
MKQIALTFDDGPNPGTTDKILSALQRHYAKATFMLWGEHVKQHPALVQQALAQGHAFGTHTYSHQSLLELTDEEIIAEMAQSDDVIKQVIGETPQFCRPPYGDIDAHVARLINRAAVIWSVDSEDWKSHDETQILARIKNYASDGDIVLMHDIQPATANVLPQVLDYLQSVGFTFVTVPELLNDHLEKMHAYYSRTKNINYLLEGEDQHVSN